MNHLIALFFILFTLTVAVICYRERGRLTYGYMDYFFPVIGNSLMWGMVFFFSIAGFAASLGSDDSTPKRIETAHYGLISLHDKDTTSGSGSGVFFLGIGGFSSNTETKTVYVSYIKLTSGASDIAGSYHRMQFDTEHSYIKEDEQKAPYVVKTEDVDWKEFTPSWLSCYFLSECKETASWSRSFDSRDQFVFHVPKGTIVEQIKIDGK